LGHRRPFCLPPTLFESTVDFQFHSHHPLLHIEDAFLQRLVLYCQLLDLPFCLPLQSNDDIANYLFHLLGQLFTEHLVEEGLFVEEVSEVELGLPEFGGSVADTEKGEVVVSRVIYLREDHRVAGLALLVR
jgi:hypothetical protein